MLNEDQLLLAMEMTTDGARGVIPDEQLVLAERLQRRHAHWVKAKGIQGFGVGRRITDGELLSEIVLKVYVKEKRCKRKCSDLVPKSFQVSGFPDRVPTDVEEIGELELQSNTGRVRPARPGFSVGRADDRPGTFGCVVQWMGDPKGIYLLSNCHVLAADGLGKIGDVIIQPGEDPDVGASPQDAIAQLASWVPLDFGRTHRPDFADAAIAKIRDRRFVTAAIPHIGIPTGVTNNIKAGDRIRKTGRKTDYTEGVIQDVNFKGSILYRRRLKNGKVRKGRVRFSRQVMCTRYSSSGDSGAVVLKGSRIAGLHFLGSSSRSVFTPISTVMHRLGVRPLIRK